MSIRVLHLSTYASNGGAARAATALDSALQEIGFESQLMTARGTQFRIARALDRQLWRLQRSPIATWRSPARFGSLTAAEVNALSADVVNLHWVTDGFMSIEEIGKITKPVVWSLYDMWPFCGTEHYGVNSPDARWRTGYSRDNRPADETGMDIDRWAWTRKRNRWTRINIVPASTWLEGAVQSSALMGTWSITKIPHVVDTHRFAPTGKTEARKRAALPQEVPLILFLASAGISDQRKGFDLLEQALVHVRSDHPDAHVVVAGPKSLGYESPSGVPIIWQGEVHGDDALRTIYCAADLLVVPSREDNMPLTAMEAQSCGVPVVAFKIGGLPDIVINEETGFLAPPGDTEALATAISQLLGQKSLREGFAASAVDHAHRTWSPTVVAKQYAHLYAQTIG